MDFAISLRDGGEVLATNADHHVARNRLLVCPECGEPVFFKRRITPKETLFFSHYQEIPTVKLLHRCSLRIEDSYFRPASQLIRGIAKGQLVDRFQREFCRELHLAFGRQSRRFGNFIRLSQHELSQSARHEFIKDVERGVSCSATLFGSLEKSDLDDFRVGLADTCRFLRSSYGLWVCRFLYQTAYFLALVMHQRTLKGIVGQRLYQVDKRNVILVLDNALLALSPETLAEKRLAANDPRNVAIFEIAPILVYFLLLKWRKQDYLLPRLFARAGLEFRVRKPINSDKFFVNTESHKSHAGMPVEGKVAAITSIASKAPSEIRSSRIHLDPHSKSSPNTQNIFSMYEQGSLSDNSSYKNRGPTNSTDSNNFSSLPHNASHGQFSSPKDSFNLAPKSIKSFFSGNSVHKSQDANGYLTRQTPSMSTSLGPSRKTLSQDEKISKLTAYAAGFMPDGGFISASQIDKIRQLIQRYWPNGFQFGCSEWQFFRGIGLLINLRTRRIYSAAQLQWHSSGVSVSKNGSVVFDIPSRQIVHALLAHT